MKKYKTADSIADMDIVCRQPYMHYVKPFRIAGSVYYVGNQVCSSHLVDTGDGLLLIDTPFARQLPLLLQAIWELGFNPADIRYILHTHAHADHVGCTPALVSLFGCKTAIGEADARTAEERPELLLPMADDPPFFLPDIRLVDGDAVRLGTVRVRAVATPGHTAGSTSYFFETVEDGVSLICGIFGGSGFKTLSRDYFKDFHIVSDTRSQFMQSLEKIRGEKVDVTLGRQPGENATFEKLRRREQGAKKNPFIDPAEWDTLISEIMRRFILFRAEDDANHNWMPRKKQP
jgi:metallo-beta-lactamase class B